MQKIPFTISLICALLSSYAQVPQLQVLQFASGFNLPVDIAHAGDDRLFVVELRGKIKIVNQQGIVTATFLDISNRVTQDPQDHGLIGLAFHPDYVNNGFFYVHYIDSGHNSNISRFRVSANPNVALPNSEDKLLSIPHPFTDHYGGDIAFGPDGYLYFAIGDGHTNTTPGIYAQNTHTLLGKMCRIDVNIASGYRIPPTNPFVNDTSMRPEIWSIGFRNPWRFSFDRHNGDLWISDVGENDWEEINYEPAASAGGLNYGWPCFEGTHSFNPAGCNATGYTNPVHEYENSTLGCSVIGGFVYRGCQSLNMYGHYVFADYCSGRLWTLYDSSGTWVTTTQGQFSANLFGSFGEDAAGEIYAVGTMNGKIYKISDSPLVSFEISDTTTVCAGDSVILNILPGYTANAWMLNGVTVGSGTPFAAKDSGAYSVAVSWNGACTDTLNDFVLAHYPQTIPGIYASDTAYCFGDSVILATDLYFSYQWSNGVTDSSITVSQPGTYTVEVFDINGCRAQSLPLNIVEHALPIPDIITVSDSFCTGDSLTLSTNLYTFYEWSTGSHLASIAVNTSGDYSVEVIDANGCRGESQPRRITGLPLPAPVITASDTTFCTGEFVTLSTAGFASYLWTDSLVSPFRPVNSPGDYAVTVTDLFGCRGESAPVHITQLPLPVVSLLPDHDTTTCSNEPVTISVNGNFSAYNWSTGVSGGQIEALATGVYNVTVQDTNGCEKAAQGITVTILPAPFPAVIEFIPPSISSSIEGDSYQWYLEDNLLPDETGQTIEDATPYGSGNYSVLVIDNNGCSTLSEEEYILWDGIENTALGAASVYPNPFKNEIIIGGLEDVQHDLQVSLLDVMGKILYAREINSPASKIEINLDKLNLAAGFYFVKIDTKKATRTLPLVKM